MAIKTAILLPDIHYPENTPLNGVNKFIKDVRPDYLVYMGDQLEMGPLSHWNKDKRKKMEGERIIRDYEGFDRDVLKVHESITKKTCNRIWITGNHEDWANQYVDKNPELEGLIEPERVLKLKERGYKVLDVGEWYKIGHLYIGHGAWTNKYHAAKHLDICKRNVCYGHTHTPQTYYHITPIDSKDYQSATCLPTLGRINPAWLKGRPNNWINGFGILYLFPNGMFNLYTIIINAGKFCFAGKTY